MLELLLKERRRKLRRHRRLCQGRKIAFLLMFLLMFFGNPQLINTETMGSAGEALFQDNSSLGPEEVTAEVLEEEVEIQDEQAVEVQVEAEVERQGEQKVEVQDEQEFEMQAGEGKIAYLTFDDGPTPYLTSVLDVLAEHEAQATFFMLEPQMRDQADVLCRMAVEGHGLGLHGVTHQRHLFYDSAESVLAEMNTAQVTLKEITGCETVLIRTPYGSRPYMKPEYWKAVETVGYKLWDWNVDSKDWFYQDERMVTEILQQIEALDKKKVIPVILLHERQETVLFLPQILKCLQSKNYVLKVPDAETVPIQFK